MTKDKVLEAVVQCVERFTSMYPDLKAARVDEGLFLETRIREDRFKTIASHALYMQEQIAIFLETGRTEKAMRWLGFLQGVMWMTGVPLNHLKEMNRPDEEKN
jgi:hypothetical protein